MKTLIAAAALALGLATAANAQMASEKPKTDAMGAMSSDHMKADKPMAKKPMARKPMKKPMAKPAATGAMGSAMATDAMAKH